MKQKLKIPLLSLLGALFVTVMGNLAGFIQVFGRLESLGTTEGVIAKIPYISTIIEVANGLIKVLMKQATLPRFDYWGPTRVIEGTINEFPYFSFLFADLHPHMIGIPFTLLLLAFGINFVLIKRKNKPQLAVAVQKKDVIKPPRMTFAILDIPERIKEILKLNKLAAIGKLRTATDEELLALAGVGPKAVEQIRVALNPPEQTASAKFVFPSIQFRPLMQSVFKQILGDLPHLIVISICFGGIFVINSWDLGVYLLILLLFFALRNDVFQFSLGHIERWIQGVVVTGVELVGVTILGLLAFIPFIANFHNPTGGIGFELFSTKLTDYLAIFGFFIFILSAFIAYQLTALIKGILLKVKDKLNVLDWLIIAGMGLIILTFLLTKLASLPLYISLLILLVLMLPVIWRNRQDKKRMLIILLAFVALCITLGTEVVYLKDHLAGGGEGSHRRMNTIFKFYNQAWILFSLGSAGLLGLLLQDIQRKVLFFKNALKGHRDILDLLNNDKKTQDEELFATKSQIQKSKNKTLVANISMYGIVGIVTLLFTAGMVYPVLGTPTRIDDRFPQDQRPGWTLDGLAFMEMSSFTYPDPQDIIELQYELEAIDWLNNSFAGQVNLLEAGCFLGFYREMGGKISAFTGFPNLSGQHEGEQRDVGHRGRDCDNIYKAIEWNQARTLLDMYQVEYIYLGQLEKNALKNNLDAYAKFSKREGIDLEKVFDNEKVKIYKVLPRVVEVEVIKADFIDEENAEVSSQDSE